MTTPQRVLDDVVHGVQSSFAIACNCAGVDFLMRMAIPLAWFHVVLLSKPSHKLAEISLDRRTPGFPTG